MPNIEWTALGEEPGCRQAAMDPQIKLFGRILSVTPSHTGAGADAGVLNPTSVRPPSSQDGGDSVLRGAENNGVSEKFVSARSSSGDEFLLLIKKATEPCGGAPRGAQQQQQLCEESEGAQSDDFRDHSSTHSVGNNDGKKPDKVVACPRCNSQDTKFCYYNNYNVNQPRHFCKNCQRYWTAGGTLRNVPVGAGRRKNKTGSLQQQRESEASPNCSSFQIDSGDYSCGLGSPKPKLSLPKRLGGQGSSMGSPGSTSSFGPDSGITMSSPSCSLYQNGRLPFQSFNSCSQGFTTSGAEMSAVGSSDSASTLRGQRLVRLPSGNGFDKDCSRSSLSEQMQDAANLQMNASMLQQRESTSDTVSGWAGNNSGPVRFFNGEWPHGYNLDWDGKHPHPASQGVAPVLTSYNTTTPSPTPSTSSWNPAWVASPWMGNNPQWTGIVQPPLQSTRGKRQGDRVEDALPAKALRTDVGSRTNVRSSWPMLQGRSPSTEVPTSDSLKQLFQDPKLEPASAAFEPKDSFLSRWFNNAVVPRPVPFPVTT